MKRQHRNPSLPARIAAWPAAMLLTIALAVTLIGRAGTQILTSEDLHVSTATNEEIVTAQMERMSDAVRDLAEEYHFDADRVIAALDRDEFLATDKALAEWWTRITTKGVLDNEIPAWSADSLLETIECSFDPEMIQEEQEIREIARGIGLLLEKTARRMQMPVRRTLIMLGFRYLDKRIDLPGIMRIAIRLPKAGIAACLLFAGLVALLMGRRIGTSLKYFGAATGGAGISCLAGLILIRSVNIRGMIRESSEGLANQMDAMMGTVTTEYILCATALLITGYVCLYLYVRRAGEHAVCGGNHEAGTNDLPDPLQQDP